MPFDLAEIAKFDEPWAMAFLPDGRMLVAEKKGRLQIVGQDGQSSGSVRGVPNVEDADVAIDKLISWCRTGPSMWPARKRR